MEFGILGPLRVSSGDGALDLGAPAQRALLAVLLTSPGTAVSDDRLVDELWGDDPPPSAHHLLQVYVSRLRALLGERRGWAAHRPLGGRLRAPRGPDELDAERFERCGRGGPAAHRPRPGGRRSDPGAGDAALAGSPLRRPAGAAAGRARAGRAPGAAAPRGPRHAGSTSASRLGRHRELVPELAGLVVQRPLRRGAPRPADAGAVPLRPPGGGAGDRPRARGATARRPRDRSLAGGPRPVPGHPAPGLAPHARAAGATGEPAEPADVVRRPDARAPRGGRAARDRPPRDPDRSRRDRQDAPGDRGGPAAAVAVPRRDMVGRPRAGDRAGDGARPAGRRPRRGADARDQRSSRRSPGRSAGGEPCC